MKQKGRKPTRPEIQQYLQQHEVSPEDTQCDELLYYLEHATTFPLFELLYHSTDTIQDCNYRIKQSHFYKFSHTLHIKYKNQCEINILMGLLRTKTM